MHFKHNDTFEKPCTCNLCEMIRQTNWIKVGDKKPEIGQQCLTWDGKWISLENFDYALDDDVCFSESGTSVTHWMPLPSTKGLDKNS